MKATVRALADTDLQDLDKLRTIVHSHRPEAFDAEWNGSIWRWLGTHPLAGELHRWVVVTSEGEVVGHLAATPQYYRIGGKRVVAHTPADYQVRAPYGFYAISLMRQFFRAVENYVSCDSAPEVIAVETRLGAEEAGQLEFAPKVWNVAGLPGFPAAIPSPIPQLLNLGLRAVDGAIGATVHGNTWKVVRLEEFDASFDELFESIAAAMPCVVEKDAAFLRWRYGAYSPQSSSILLGVKEEDRLLGYAVLWVTSDGDDGYLLDLTTRPGHHEVARSLLLEAVQVFRRARVHSIRYRFIPSPTTPLAKDLWRLGFLLGTNRRSTLLVKFADQTLQQLALRTTHWSYGFGDGQATFWIK
jgi:hypothetical protein